MKQISLGRGLSGCSLQVQQLGVVEVGEIPDRQPIPLIVVIDVQNRTTFDLQDARRDRDVLGNRIGLPL